MGGVGLEDGSKVAWSRLGVGWSEGEIWEFLKGLVWSHFGGFGWGPRWLEGGLGGG